MSEPIKVLIVDDIASTLDNLQKLLSFEPDIQVVATAVNGKEGVEQAKKVVPDIVLMDVNMPIMDGIQATEMLAQEAPWSPCIIMSVHGERDQAEGRTGRPEPAVRRHQRAAEPGPLPGHYRSDRKHRPHGPGLQPGDHVGRPVWHQGPAHPNQPGAGGPGYRRSRTPDF